MAFRIDISGVPGVNKELLAAAERYRSKAHTRKVLRPAGQAARGHLRNEVAGTPFENSTGNLRKSVKTISLTRSRAVFVGPRVNKGTPDGYYFGWMNSGTKVGHKAHRMIEKMMAKHKASLANMIGTALVNDLKYLT